MASLSPRKTKLSLKITTVMECLMRVYKQSHPDDLSSNFGLILINGHSDNKSRLTLIRHITCIENLMLESKSILELLVMLQ